jgi:hypothetical protein
MKYYLALLSIVLVVVQCKKDTPTISNSNNGTQVYTPVSVVKTTTKKIFVHYMPWFETPSTNNGAWGQHWTMSNENPNIVNDTGRRQIASYYYPLTDPYASSDSNIIEYQLLLMKLSGIDGVLIDWPTTIQQYDYPKNISNAEALIAECGRVGLKYGVVYEDNNYTLASIPSDQQITGAQSDMTYMQTHYFDDTSYIYLNNKPLLLVFGPQTFKTETDWTSIFSDLQISPTFLTLWYQHGQAGSNSQGEFAWVYSDYLNGLTNFYQNETNYGIKMGVSYPGFNAFYQAGGWGSNPFTISVGLSTFSSTLDKALQSTCTSIQLATWNDYGEGTMIEPTSEFGFGFLTALQQKLGVTYGQSELEMIKCLYNDRLKFTDNTTKQKLDQVFYDIVSLRIDSARNLLDSIQ